MKTFILPNHLGGWSLYPARDDGVELMPDTRRPVGNYATYDQAHGIAAMSLYEVANRREDLDTPDLSFVGVQLPRPILLYNLKREIKGHPKNSTISAETARAAGLQVPNIPTL